MNIAIIGAGLSGSNVLKTILEHPNFSKKDRIDIFEPRELLGPGMPYAPDDKNVMLNIAPGKLSVDMNDKDDFIKWLTANYDEPENYEDLVSRPQYGQYLLERFEESYQHPQVAHLQEKVIDIEVDLKNSKSGMYKEGEAASYRIKTESGFKDIPYHAVFFAIGHPPYKDDYNLLGSPNYIHNPYPLTQGLGQLDNNQKIGVTGSGAASVDFYRYFKQNYALTHPLTFYVRESTFYFPAIPYEGEPYTFTLSMNWITAEKKKHGGFIPFELIFHTIEDDLKKENVNLHQVYDTYKDFDVETVEAALESKNQELALVQAYFGDLGILLPHLFNALNGVEKDAYLMWSHEKLLLFRSLVPYKTAINLLNDYKAGNIRLVFGIREIIPDESANRFKVIANETEYTDVLINGTGFQTDLAKASQQDQLIHNLYNRKFILPQQDGHFVLIDWPRTRIMNQHFGVLNNAFFLGPYIRGSEYENNNAETIARQAIFSANWFMDHYEN